MKSKGSRALTRTSIRLRGYSYTIAGSYFLTICSYRMRPVFGRVRAGRVDLSALGRLVQTVWTDTPDHFPGTELDEFIVMPNHFHAVLTNRSGEYRGDERKVEEFSQPVAGSIPTIVRCFKAAVTKKAREAGIWGNRPLWQRGYYEHVVRTGESLKEIRWYIQQNPVQWELDRNQRARHVVPLQLGSHAK